VYNSLTSVRTVRRFSQFLCTTFLLKNHPKQRSKSSLSRASGQLGAADHRIFSSHISLHCETADAGLVLHGPLGSCRWYFCVFLAKGHV